MLRPYLYYGLLFGLLAACSGEPAPADSCVDCLEQDPQTLYVKDPETGEVRPLEQGDIDRDPCYWCVQVLNSPLNPPLFDCSDICPCEAAVPEVDHSTLRHTGTIHDTGFFTVLNTEDGIDGLQPASDPNVSGPAPCVTVNSAGVATLKITYSMKYPCEDLDEIEEESILTLALSQPGRKGFLVLDSTQVSTTELVRDPCCFRDNECILSRTLSFEYRPELDSLGFSDAFELTFTIEHDHPDTILPSEPAENNDQAKLSDPFSTASTATEVDWSHAHFYSETIRFCSESASDQ